ncbi:MAG: acyltransferase family protein [Lachnospiraceae bacterium]|nr:acyltransferase family protein [Lachnospiraceae bacterium]
MRQKWIDNAKGIAILMIIIGHVSGGLGDNFNFKFVYGIHLVTFFIISGFNLNKKSISSEYLNKSFKRLMIPYFYTSFAILITDVLNNYIHHKETIEEITKTIGNDLIRIFFASGSITKFGTIEIGTRIGAIWFLPALFFAKLLFQIVLNKFSDNDEIIGACCGCVALLGYVSARFIWFPFSIQSGMMATFFLWIGYEIKNKNLLDQLNNKRYLLSLAILLIGIRLEYCNVGFVTAYINDVILSIIVGIAGFVLIYWMSTIFKGIILEKIGRNSLYVLCAHLYALETMRGVFDWILNSLRVDGYFRIWLFILLEILFAVMVAFAIVKVKELIKPGYDKLFCLFNSNERNVINRDYSLDVLKGILIISMLIGQFAIDGKLRLIIYSCHMVAFITISGFFYKPSNNVRFQIYRNIKRLILPYISFVAMALLIDHGSLNESNFVEKIARYFYGISFSNKLFVKIKSVGPAYFILMMFVICMIFIIIDRCIHNKTMKWGVYIIISLLGYYLGKSGYWLPWSIDIALYGIVYFEIGHLLKEKQVLDFIKSNKYIYFLISPIWIYMIYVGGMEIAIRNYGQYGIVILGSVMGMLTIYIFADYIANNLVIIGCFLRKVGQYSLFVLIIHTLLSGRVKKIVSLRFNPTSFTNMVTCIFIQLFISVLLGLIIDKMKFYIE